MFGFVLVESLNYFPDFLLHGLLSNIATGIVTIRQVGLILDLRIGFELVVSWILIEDEIGVLVAVNL